MNDDFSMDFMDDDETGFSEDKDTPADVIFKAVMSSGTKKMMLFSFFDSMKSLIELSKGVPILFCFLSYSETIRIENE